MNGSIDRSQTARPEQLAVDFLLFFVAKPRRLPRGRKNYCELAHVIPSFASGRHRSIRPDSDPVALRCQLIDRIPTRAPEFDCHRRLELAMLDGLHGSRRLAGKEIDNDGVSRTTMCVDGVGMAARAGSRLGAGRIPSTPGPNLSQGSLFKLVPYQDEAPSITTEPELSGAIEHLHYAVFRRYNNQLTRAERSRLDNTIDNALFKIDRYLLRAEAARLERHEGEVESLRDAIREGREQLERQRRQARRADLKLAQLSSLTPESFEEFVAELFEAIGYDVRAGRRHWRRRRRPPPATRRWDLGRRSVQISQEKRGRLTRAPEVPGHDPPHSEPQGILRHDQHVFPVGREIRRRTSDRARGRNPAGGAGHRSHRTQGSPRARASLVPKRLKIAGRSRLLTRKTTIRPVVFLLCRKGLRPSTVRPDDPASGWSKSQLLAFAIKRAGVDAQHVRRFVEAR